MKSPATALIHRNTLFSALLDISALTFIYLVPTISHLLSVPVYLIEPMRLMLIFAMVHTSKKNAYLLALSMPVFSLIISGHPELPKMILISIELLLNVFLFYFLVRKVKNIFTSIIMSIIVSKITYYILKYALIQILIIKTELFSTPIIIQLATTLIYSLYLFVFYKKQTE